MTMNFGAAGVQLKVGEMWILGEGLNGVRRLVRAPPTSAAAMTRQQ